MNEIKIILDKLFEDTCEYCFFSYRTDEYINRDYKIFRGRKEGNWIIDKEGWLFDLQKRILICPDCIKNLDINKK